FLSTVASPRSPSRDARWGKSSPGDTFSPDWTCPSYCQLVLAVFGGVIVGCRDQVLESGRELIFRRHPSDPGHVFHPPLVHKRGQGVGDVFQPLVDRKAPPRLIQPERIDVLRRKLQDAAVRSEERRVGKGVQVRLLGSSRTESD